MVNNVTVYSGVTLHDVLGEIRSYLRKTNDERTAASTYIWVDALCINQKDTLEKNHQVAMMNDIYSGAQEVLMWIRFDPMEVDIAFSLLEDQALVVNIFIEQAPKWNASFTDIFQIALAWMVDYADRNPLNHPA